MLDIMQDIFTSPLLNNKDEHKPSPKSTQTVTSLKSVMMVSLHPMMTMNGKKDCAFLLLLSTQSVFTPHNMSLSPICTHSYT